MLSAIGRRQYSLDLFIGILQLKIDQLPQDNPLFNGFGEERILPPVAHELEVLKAAKGLR